MAVPAQPTLYLVDGHALAYAHCLRVVPHIGDMVQIYVQQCFALPACALLEYIPWLRDFFEEPSTVESGMLRCPELSETGTTVNATALSWYGVERVKVLPIRLSF